MEIYGEWGRQIREIRSTQSFSTMNTLAANFGIGTATAIDSIVVRWPSGMRTKLDAPAINTTHIIPEAECLLAEETITAAGPTAICPGASVVLRDLTVLLPIPGAMERPLKTLPLQHPVPIT